MGTIYVRGRRARGLTDFALAPMIPNAGYGLSTRPFTKSMCSRMTAGTCSRPWGRKTSRETTRLTSVGRRTWHSFPTEESWLRMVWIITGWSFSIARGTTFQSLAASVKGPGQFNGIHAIGIGPQGLIFALDRSGGRINVFRTTDDPAEVEFVDVWSGFTLPLDIIVNDEHLWMTDLGPLRFIKMDFEGNQLYTWNVPSELPDGYLEVHTFSVDSNLNLYGGDNQYGRTQKFVPKPDADPALIIGPPWVAR